MANANGARTLHDIAHARPMAASLLALRLLPGRSAAYRLVRMHAAGREPHTSLLRRAPIACEGTKYYVTGQPDSSERKQQGHSYAK